MSSNNSLTAATPSSDGLDGAYIALDRAAHGSPEHFAAVADIQAHERAYAKSQENVIKGTGRSGHENGSYGIVPKDAVPGYEMRSPGGFSDNIGQASPDLRTDIVKIGGFETSLAVGEAMRRSMSAGEWTALTGLPYENITQTDRAAILADEYKPRFAIDPKLQGLQDALDKSISLEEMTAAEADAKRQIAEVDAISFDTSLIEQVMVNSLGPDVTEKITRQVVDAGDFDAEALAKYGVTQDMYQDALVHYQTAAETMLAPVNSSVAYLENFLSDAEAVKVRQAIVSRDMSVTQHYGEVAKNRAASMNHKEVSDFLSKGERAQLRLRSQGGQAVIDLPNGITTSWSAAIINGLISFSSK